MARTFTAPERAAMADGHHNVYAKLELSDPDAAWVDVSTGLDGGSADWFNNATLEDAIDANCLTMSASLLRDKGAESALSLSPLREDSELNRDALDAYAPFLDVARSWRVSVAVVLHGVAVVGGDWKEIGAGMVDTIGINDPSPTIEIRGRDWGASLLDRFIDTVRTYGNSPPPGIPMEDVIQEMLDDNLGVGEITLYTPVSPLMEMAEWEQGADESLMSAINRVARLAAMVVRYRYDASNVARLTLYAPDRDAGPGDEDWELGPTEYTALPQASLDISGVRNPVVATYYDETTNGSATVDAEDAGLQTRYGGPHDIPRPLLIDLAKETNITSAARAQALVDAVLSDVKTPPFLQVVEAPGFWIPQLSDFGKFLANGVHYDTDQYGGVTHLTFRIENGTLKTTIRAGGQPRGKYRTWVTEYSPPGPDDIASMVIRAKIQSTTSTQVVVRVAVADMVAGNGDVVLTYVGVGVGAISPASPRTLAASGITNDPDTTVTVDITVDRPAFQAGTGRITFLARRNKRVVAIDAVDVPAIERDTVELLCRAKVQSTSATQVVFRVAVADYVSGGSGDVTLVYTVVGCTISSPASPQTLASAGITANIDTTATVDVTVNRAAFQAGMGRITFTATRTGRVPSTDSGDVPSLDSAGPSLTVTPTPGETSYSIVWSGTGTVNVSIDGAAYAAPSASPITVTRTTVDQTYAFRSVLDGQTITSTVVIPKTYAGATLSIGAPWLDKTADTLDVNWSSGGMPSGVKFNVSYVQNGSDGVSESANDVTSVHQFTGVTGATAVGSITVTAEKDGVVVASRVRAGAWPF